MAIGAGNRPLQLELCGFFFHSSHFSHKNFLTMRECTPQVPLVKLDPNGKPALLNYNLPQSTVYEAISAVDLKVGS